MVSLPFELSISMYFSLTFLSKDSFIKSFLSTTSLCEKLFLILQKNNVFKASIVLNSVFCPPLSDLFGCLSILVCSALPIPVCSSLCIRLSLSACPSLCLSVSLCWSPSVCLSLSSLSLSACL